MALSPQDILERLREAGYTALYVGGYVRDHMLELEPMDVDLATNAPIDVCEKLFADARLDVTGKHFAVLRVDGYELAGFRGERYIVPGKPEVWPASTFEADAARRDFTINAMARDLDGVLYDPFDGQSDLQAEIIRAVGVPDDRFREDPIRILRALNLKARTGFTIEPKTSEAMIRCADLLATLPIERITQELNRALDARSLSFFVDAAQNLGLLEYILPELTHLPGLDIAVREDYSPVWEHSITSLRFVESVLPGNRVLAWATLFRYAGMGKPITKEVDEYELVHSIGNDILASRLFPAVAARLGLGDALCRDVVFYLRWQTLDFITEPGAAVRHLNKLAVHWPHCAALREAISNLNELQVIDIIICRTPELRRLLLKLQLTNDTFGIAMDEVPFYYSDAGISGDTYVGKLEGAEFGKQMRRDLLAKQCEAVQRWYDRYRPLTLPKHNELPTDCVLRLASEADVPSLRVLVNAAYAELGAMGMNYLGVSQDEAVTLSRMAGKEVWVIEKNNELLATISLHGDDGDPDKGETPAWSIGQFGVHPEHKGKGLGTHLLYHAFQRARDMNYSVVRLDTAVTAFHLVHLYRRFGFATVYVDQWRRTNYPSFIMEADSAYTLNAL